MKPNLFSALAVLLLVAAGQVNAQSPRRDARPRAASISGRVTVSGAPAANALVTVVEVDPQTWDVWFGRESSEAESFDVRTDSDGRYRVTGLAEGAYVIRALSKSYVLSKSLFGVETFKSVTLDEGEARDGIDISLVRGGVITGRVIDAEGKPVIGAGVRLFYVDEKGGPKGEPRSSDWWMFQTDDRGVYRLFGLTAGRYVLSAGGKEAPNLVSIKSPETFYPDATDRAQAKIIEIKEGAEVADIDIRLGAGRETYQAAGRVVDAETGKPLRQVSMLCMQAPDKKNGGTRYGRSATTDDEGRFTCAGLDSGRYELSLLERLHICGEYYIDNGVFEVTDSNLSGLEVKAIRGSTISGVVVIEGVSEPEVRAKLQRMSVGMRGARRYECGITARVAGDGSFRLVGAPAGTASFYLDEHQEQFFIRRIERDGVETRSAFEIGRGEQITGFRIVVAQSNGTIRGQVDFTGVNLPEGCRLTIWAIPVKTATSNEGNPLFYSNGHRDAVADEKGRFVIERLPPGEYDLRLSAMVRVSQNNWSSAPGTSGVGQRVTVSNGSETIIKLALDPARN